MKRLDLPYVQCRKGRYWYFVRASTGQCVRLPDPKDPAFLMAYDRLKRGKTIVPSRTSFSNLIASYKRSHDFAALAVGTRRNYDRHLAYFAEMIGPVDVRKFRHQHAHEMLQANADRPVTANARFDVLKGLIRHAMDMGWIDRNPIADVKKLRVVHEHHAAWPANVRRDFEAAADGATLLFYEIAVTTGQRSGDILKLKWSDIDGDLIRFKQEKTKAEVVLPIPPRLAAVLAKTAKTGVYVIDERGPISGDAMYKRVKRTLQSIGHGQYTRHGLRATKAQEMAAAGHTDEVIMAVTGHTRASSLDSYTGQVRQLTRARKGMEGA